MGRLESIYAKLPVWAQHVAVSAYGCYWYWYRFGPGSRALATEYRERDFWTREQWSHWQREHLAALLQRAMKHVPYYERAWTKSDQLAAREGRIAELPLLEKEPLRANYRDFLDQSRAGVATKICHTSGSTGTPIATVWTREEMRRAMAVREARSAGWAGVSFHRSRATFSGRMAEPDPESRGPYYRYNWPERQVYFSPFHLRPDTAAQYVRALERHQVEWLTGYAVSYYLLAKMIVEHSLPRPTRLKAVVTTSEKLTAEMRAVMQTAYGCRVYEEYSTVENVLFASECPAGKLHVSPDVGLVEILRSDGSPCEPGEPGEVVATCFMRTHQPLIRYRVGDVASWSAEPCDCGRAMPVIQEVCGRVEDVAMGQWAPSRHR